MKLPARTGQVLREIGTLRREVAVLAAIDDDANPHATVGGGLKVLQDLRILEHADLDPDVVPCGLDRPEVQLATVIGQHRERAGPKPTSCSG